MPNVHPLVLTLVLSGAGAANSELIDPTHPSGFRESSAAPATAGEKLTLSLIRLGPEPLAVINGENVQPGETIAGYRLLSLQTTSATLASSNGRIVLQLSPTIRKSNINNPAQNRQP